MRIDGNLAIEMAMQYHNLQQLGLYGQFSTNKLNGSTAKVIMRNNPKKKETDPHSILERIGVSQNKFFILRLMKRGDLISLLHLLDKDQMMYALQLFPKSKLMMFINSLPKETILKMLMDAIPLQALLAMFKSKVLFSIMNNKRMDVRQIVKNFEHMPEETLQQLMQLITGQNMAGMKKEEIMHMMMDLKKHTIVEAMKRLPEKTFREYAFHAISEDPQIMMSIPKAALTDIIQKMPKPNMLELFAHLEPDMLIQFLSQLPDKFLALAVSQLDDNTFSEIMVSQYGDLIQDLAA